MYKSFLLALILWISVRVVAQEQIKSGVDGVHHVSFEIAGNPAATAQMGYSWRSPLLFRANPVYISFALGAPVFLLKDLDSFYIRIGTQLMIAKSSRFFLSGGLYTAIATNHNPNGKNVAWNFGLRIFPGVCGEKFYFGLNLLWKPTIFTYIKHSDFVKNTFKERYNSSDVPEIFSGPKDGWYSYPANKFEFGISGGYTVKHKITFYLNGGLIDTPNNFDIFMFGDIGQIPYYVRLGTMLHY